MRPESGRGSHYLWLSLSTSVVAFGGFTVTYFGPLLQGVYPSVSPTVHVHGWTFFLWYVLFPLQAILVSVRRVAIHRSLGKASLALAIAMIGTGLIVIGTQMELARQPDGSPFWRVLGPSIFMTLVLFGVFYGLAFHFRRRRELHKRFMLLASTGALGAAAFRLVGALIGFGPAAGFIGILAPNLIIVAAIILELSRGEGIHPVFKVGLMASVAAEGGMLLLTPTPVGEAIASALATVGRQLSGLY